MRTIHDVPPLAVISAGPSAAAAVLRALVDRPVVELDPYDLAMERIEPRAYGAVVVENFVPEVWGGGLSQCTPSRWLLPRQPLTVVNGDDPAGRRLAAWGAQRVFAYSDGDPRADLTAKNMNLRWGRLEFDALAQSELERIRLPKQTDMYGALAALGCALGLGMPLKEAARRLSGICAG